MILGIGFDIVEVQRFDSWLETPGLLSRFFHPQELAACMRGSCYNRVSIAARYAAKEAFGKALGSGMRGLVLSDIEVRGGYSTQPTLVLHRSALEAAGRFGVRSLHLSLSHERSHAAAMVVLEE